MRRRLTWLTLTLLLAAAFAPGATAPEATLFFFWGRGCPVCEEAKPFVAELQRRYPALEVASHDVMADRAALELWLATAERHGDRAGGVPAFYVGGRAFAGFSPETAAALEEAVRAALGNTGPAERERLTLPLLGEVDAADISLPLLTLLLAALDSFNPCAFFVLLFLLGLLVHARSRARMFLIGGTFVLCSGAIYFLFMAAWLNLFLLVGHLTAITATAGAVAVVIGLINAKDFFLFHEGVTLSIPEGAKPKLFARMRGLLRAESPAAMLAGALVLAVAANSYELLCTAGFPMVYTRALTLHALTPGRYYLYLALYNVIYVVPLAAIVALFTATLGRRKLSEWQGRVLKLLSGTMMLLLGTVLLAAPERLNQPATATALLAAALGATALLAWAVRRREVAKRD